MLGDVISENLSGADNQQGSPNVELVTPQRPHAELLAVDADLLQAYLQGALGDATYSFTHRTFRFGQADEGWLATLGEILGQLGHTSWTYREGRQRRFWVLETTANFLNLGFDPRALRGSTNELAYMLEGSSTPRAARLRTLVRGSTCSSHRRTGIASKG